MSKTEAAERIMEIAEEIRELLQEAMELAGKDEMVYNRARSYWYPHILTSLGGDHGYLGGSMCSMEDTARELEEAGDEDEGCDHPWHEEGGGDTCPRCGSDGLLDEDSY
jgi:hypothetical protein